MDREDLLKLDDRSVISVEIPQWGKTVHLRSWTAGERADLQRWFHDAKEKGVELDLVGARIAVMSLCDGKGKRLLTDDDIPVMQNKSAVALDLISQAALKLNGLSAEAIETEKKT